MDVGLVDQQCALARPQAWQQRRQDLDLSGSLQVVGGTLGCVTARDVVQDKAAHGQIERSQVYALRDEGLDPCVDELQANAGGKPGPNPLLDFGHRVDHDQFPSGVRRQAPGPQPPVPSAQFQGSEPLLGCQD